MEGCQLRRVLASIFARLLAGDRGTRSDHALRRHAEESSFLHFLPQHRPFRPTAAEARYVVRSELPRVEPWSRLES